MNAPPSGSRSCHECGGLNFGGLERCILCGAAMTPRANAATPAVAFCGECGAALEPGLKFCGECGTPVVSSGSPVQAGPARKAPPPGAPTPRAAQATPNKPLSPAEMRWAPPAPGAPPNATAPAKKFCAKCGTLLKPGTRFCRKCGRDSQAPSANAQATQRTRQAAPPVTKPARPPASSAKAASAPRAAPAPRPAPAPPTPAKPPSQLLKKTLRVIVPVGSMVATYFLTNKVFGPMLAQQFGDASRQMVPMLVSMAVGGVARQITK